MQKQNLHAFVGTFFSSKMENSLATQTSFLKFNDNLRACFSLRNRFPSLVFLRGFEHWFRLCGAYGPILNWRMYFVFWAGPALYVCYYLP